MIRNMFLRAGGLDFEVSDLVRFLTSEIAIMVYIIVVLLLIGILAIAILVADSKNRKDRSPETIVVENAPKNNDELPTDPDDTV